MTKKFTLLQLFSIVDGRLSTDIGDVYEMLNHITDDNLMTHHLPVAMKYLQMKNPIWYIELKGQIDNIKSLLCPIKEETKEQFIWLIDYIKTGDNNTVHNIPQLKDEFDTSYFGTYMIENSLLLKRL